jgi:hypothetical protein
MKLFALVTLFITGLTCVQAQNQIKSTPLMGNYKIVKAICNGEDMLWKKHDKVIFSGGIMAIGGSLSSVEENKECRFQDIYSRLMENFGVINESYNETSALIPVTRREACWDVVNGERVEDSLQIKQVEITNTLTKLEASKSGQSLVIQIDESLLCDGLAELHLEHNIQ